MPFKTGSISSQAEAERLALELPVKVIAIVGDQDSGKTTLLAANYCAFWDGPVGKWSFASSRSIVEFERKVHRARMSSGAASAKVERTRATGEVGFLHLSLCRYGDDQQPVHALFSDRAGEEYEAARARNDECKKLVELRLADKTLYLLDGLKLAHPRYRASAIATATQFLRRTRDTAMLKEETVELIVTKADYLEEASGGDAALRPRLDSDIDKMRLALSFKSGLPVRYLSPLATRSMDAPTRNKARSDLGLALDNWLSRAKAQFPGPQQRDESPLGKFVERVFGK